MKIDFDGIQAFVAIAELGGFSKAAEHLHVTQTALTRRLQKLEAYLDLRLLDRTTRYVELTAVGREFLPQAKSIVGEVTRAVGTLKDMSSRGKGNFTIACIPTMASQALPVAIRRYAVEYPGNRIRIIDASGFEVRDAVLHGQAELGIGLPTDRHPELEELQLLEDPYMFFCREEHPLSKREHVVWSDLHEADLIAISTMSANRLALDVQLAKHGINISGRYEVRHLSTAIGLVAAGVGAAILPSSTLEVGARPGLIRIPLKGPTIKRKIVVIRKRNTTLSPAADAFMRMLLRDGYQGNTIPMQGTPAA
ncbi:LysR family transcriptional regulator [Parazoarcus communis]|uniref:LysR family transcriptional regulator n=1 Tax=Parazoarcus communis TaxID=41977 RepID=A0A2U8GL45_9RHOO|nr:LysR family transcriptional regulator [Parazoarcus communis]AWI74301.1 LysR family transcriptional regulator [Parazoarcus communis]